MAALAAETFLHFQEQVYNALSEAEEAAFSRLPDDEQRARFVSRLLAAKELRLPRATHTSPKDATQALERRNEGNRAFQKGDYNAAQQFYTISLQVAHDPETVCVALANRSAALYHMKQYQLVLDDLAELERIAAYPKHLKYKVLERKARCFLALEQRLKARDAFRVALVALDDAQLEAERKAKLRTDVQIMLVMLEKGAALQDAALPAPKVVTAPPVEGGASRLFPSASSLVRFEWGGEDVGRVGRAAAPVRPGAVVLVERPAVAALLHQRRQSHCWHCLERLQTALPCPTCADVLFCNAACRDAALAAHHRAECAFLPGLRTSGASITCYLALRLVSTHNPQQLRSAMEAAAARDPRVLGDEVYDSSQLSCFFRLVSHVEQRTTRDTLQRTLMALFLLDGLLQGVYFDKPTSLGAELGADQATVAAALLLTLQIAQFNSHEVAELVASDDQTDPVSLFVGGALYPTLALLNHSCNPSVVRYFAPGGVVVVRSVRSLQPGEELSENYGPLWTRETREVRRRRLREQYWFECACEACEEDWPLFQHIPEDAVRLRCGACAAAVKFAEQQIVATCLVCGHKTSVLASLAGVADTERKMELAKLRALDKPEEALDMFVQILEAFDKFLAPPPCKDYILCQQALRRCLLLCGNYHKKVHSKK